MIKCTAKSGVLLLCYEGEAAEGHNLQLLVLLLQPCADVQLVVAIAELELLVYEAALLLEFLHATACDTLNHGHLQLGLALSLSLGDDLAGLVRSSPRLRLRARPS